MCIRDRYSDVFRTEPGRARFYEHQLTLTENASFVQRTYPIPLHYRDEVEKEIQQMLANGVIERASSPYINPLVAVTNSKPEFSMYGGKLYKLCSHRWKNNQK